MSQSHQVKLDKVQDLPEQLARARVLTLVEVEARGNLAILPVSRGGHVRRRDEDPNHLLPHQHHDLGVLTPSGYPNGYLRPAPRRLAAINVGRVDEHRGRDHVQLVFAFRDEDAFPLRIVVAQTEKARQQLLLEQVGVERVGRGQARDRGTDLSRGLPVQGECLGFLCSILLHRGSP